MRNRVHISPSNAAFAACLALLAGCSSGGPYSHTPLADTQLNRTYRLSSSTNTAHIGAFLGPIHNTPPHAQQGPDYYSDADATFTLFPDSTGSVCVEEPFTLTGRLTNPAQETVYINLTGTVSGGTMTLSGVVKGATTQSAGTITGTYNISGGTCQVADTSFTATAE
ncbi:MAG: hypothetical protein JSS87_03290 [Acidobacteria bacterium]|nr:hypothetical protein [Acidobacteriota bacterium]